MFLFLQCVYPLGVSSNATLIVKRQASEVVNFKRKRKKNYKQGKNEVIYALVSYPTMLIENKTYKLINLDVKNTTYERKVIIMEQLKTALIESQTCHWCGTIQKTRFYECVPFVYI